MSTTRVDLNEVPIAPEPLRYAAAGLAYLLAVLYLFNPSLGFPGFVTYLEVGTPLYDPRPAAMVVSGVALIVGVKLALVGVPRRPIYLAGVALLVAHLLGYVAWHATGHGGFLPWRPARTHDQHVLATVVDHLAADPWALASKLAEVALLALLLVLLLWDRTDAE